MPGGGFETLSAGSMAITGWTVTTGSIDWIGSYWQPADGKMSLDMDGNNPGGIQVQTDLSTTVGQQYLLTFDLSGNPDGPPTTKRLQVQAGPATQSYSYTLIPANTESNMLWKPQTLLFTATSASTMLTFTSLDSNSPWGPALDNVHMNAVPESSTVAIWSLLGVLGTCVSLRRKRAT